MCLQAYKGPEWIKETIPHPNGTPWLLCIRTYLPCIPAHTPSVRDEGICSDHLVPVHLQALKLSLLPADYIVPLSHMKAHLYTALSKSHTAFKWGQMLLQFLQRAHSGLWEYSVHSSLISRQHLPPWVRAICWLAVTPTECEPPEYRVVFAFLILTQCLANGRYTVNNSSNSSYYS